MIITLLISQLDMCSSGGFNDVDVGSVVFFAVKSKMSGGEAG